MTIKTPEQSLPPGEPVKKVEEKAHSPSISTIFSALGLFLLELLLPVVISGPLFWFLFNSFNIWQYGMTLALILFGVAVVVIALMLSVVIDSYLTGIRRGHKKKGVKFASGSNARLVKMAFGGVIIPVALVVAANFVVLPALGSQTPMNWLVTVTKQSNKITQPEEVAALALQSIDPTTKILSIQVLQTYRSPLALSQLLRLVNEDPVALKDAGVYHQLVKAIAEYGTDVKDPLVRLFMSIDPAVHSESAGTGGDLFDRYFSRSFDSLSGEINQGPGDQASKDAQLAQLQAAQVQLKSSLASVEETLPTNPDSGDARLDFVVKTFLATNFKSDTDLLTFAKSIAADTRYSSQVRGDCLLLIAKLGDKNELEYLYTYLQNNDTLLQKAALQGIAALQAKVNNTKSK